MKIRIIMPKDFYKSSKNKNLYPVKVVVHRKNKTFTAIRYKKINNNKDKFNNINYHIPKKKEKNSMNNEQLYHEITLNVIKENKDKKKFVKKLNAVKINGKEYKVDGKTVVSDHTTYEKSIAKWISKNLGGGIYLYPRILYPQGIKTPDYIWEGEKWDLKTINSHSKNTITTAIKNSKNQSNNVILDLKVDSYTDCDLSKELERIYLNKRYNFLNKILIIREYKLIGIYKRK